MSLFSEIEKSIERGFERWTERMFGPADSSQLMLVHRAILEDAAGQVRTLARGRRVFPFARVTVTLVAAANDRAIARQKIEADFEAKILATLSRAEADGNRLEFEKIKTVIDTVRAETDAQRQAEQQKKAPENDNA